MKCKGAEGCSNKGLRSQVPILHDHLKNLERKTDRQEQYSRSSCLLAHKINENKDEYTNELVNFSLWHEYCYKLEQTDLTHRTSCLKKDSANKNLDL